MKIINYFFIAYFISILPANAQLFGGQIKTKNPLLNQYPIGSTFCNEPTAIVDVINPTTGKIWMDRNLGASRAAISSTDLLAYGDLYQWGRRNDGHQCRNSTTTSTLSSTDQPANNLFIIVSISPFDWRSPQNNNLWQGVNGINNPCPNGYRIPTIIELNAEISSWSNLTSSGAFASPLKFTVAGDRLFNNGTLVNVGNVGLYHSSTYNGALGKESINFDSTSANLDNSSSNAYGMSVRCIKDASAIQATVGALNCGSTSVTGILTNGIASSGVSAAVPYNGGNGGSYAAQTLSSTGVAGLTATLTSGNLANGSGSLSFAISGTPIASGTASFALTFGGQTCSFTISVQSALAAQYPANSVFCASGPTAIVDVTNPTTGKIWMDRNLGASRAATSSTDSQSYGDLYQWGRGNDGHQCRNSSTTNTLSSTDQAGNGSFITASPPNYDWRSPQNNNLWQGVNGVNKPCPSGYRLPTETELNAEITSWSQNNSEGAFSSPLKFTKGGNRDGDVVDDVGTIGRYSSSTVDSTISKYLFISGSAYMSNTLRAFGISVRCIKDASVIPPTVGALNCGSTSVTGALTNGIAASGVSAEVPYTGGNGGSYATQSISSTGVTGITATLTSGILANGSGLLSFSISGTPSTSGTASFALTIGGQTCSFTVNVIPNYATQYPTNSVFCASGPTAIVDVTNPTTGKTWMDRNLGASQAGTSSTDSAAYGDLYQWGRGNDGHQCRTSATTTSLSTSNTPGNSLFIINNSVPVDWRSPQNNNLWQGVNGLNNPCPSGYRLPTENELNAERASWNSDNYIGAFSSPLKFTLAGRRRYQDGALYDIGTWGNVWTSTVDANGLSRGSNYYSSASGMFMGGRATGYSVRCIKDASAIPATVGALNCGSTSIIGTLTSGTAASGVSASVPYTSGNSGSYLAQSFSSTGVTGLTATLTAETLAYGSGSFSFAISGTPSASGTANFALTIGGQSCSFTISVQTALAEEYPANSVFCASGPTAIVDVTNPTTGKVWMDRNLGATQVATSSSDENSYGDLYQWGRGNDGHQCRNSSTTSTLSSTDQPANGSFITIDDIFGNLDWRSPQNNNLWQGVNGVNKPCPSGYRLPTETELDAERTSWSSNNAVGSFASPLKLPLAAFRGYGTGTVINLGGILAQYWSSTVGSSRSRFIAISNFNASIGDGPRADGNSVRCIKN